MSGFDFDGSDETTVADAGNDDADTGTSAADAVDTAVSPADPEPLDDLDSHTDARALASDGSDALVDALLYAGEESRATLPVADGHLVATSHRLLVYTPEAEDRATLRAAHRVNVSDVSVTATGAGWLIRPTAYALLGGTALVLVGSAVSFDSMSTAVPQSAGMTGVGGLLSMISGVLSLLALVDDLLRVVGALSLLVGAVLLGAYAYTRGGEVVVETEGDPDDYRVDAGDADGDAVDRFLSEAGLADGDGEKSGFFGR